jgi:hypothetical protein
MKRIATALRTLGPYAAIELLLPGGSLVALSLWGYRNRSMLAKRARRVFARLPAPKADLAN